MTINQALTLARKLMSNHKELKNWSVTHNNRKRAFGVCRYNKRQIELSALLVPAMTEDAIRDTIIHEIAHALTPGHNHNRVWKMKCIELGGDGQRCGGANKYKDGAVGQATIQQSLAKYTLTCPVCGEAYHKNRKPTRSHSCGKHGKGYRPEYKLILTQNY